jgi:hypothetical protein
MNGGFEEFLPTISSEQKGIEREGRRGFLKEPSLYFIADYLGPFLPWRECAIVFRNPFCSPRLEIAQV